MLVTISFTSCTLRDLLRSSTASISVFPTPPTRLNEGSTETEMICRTLWILFLDIRAHDLARRFSIKREKGCIRLGGVPSRRPPHPLFVWKLRLLTCSKTPSATAKPVGEQP